MELSRHWRMQKIRYQLVGERCPECGPIFPPRDVCPKCGRMVIVRGLVPDAFDGEQFKKEWAERNAKIERERE